METIQIKKANAVKAYNSADDKGKSMLSDLLGKEHFAEVTERIFTLEDACNDQGINYNTVFDGIEDEYEKAEKALKIFAKSMRQGKHESECFYYPYFYISGGGFSCDGCNYGGAFAHVGARLRVDTREKAIHMGKCMLSYYKTYIT